MILMKALIPAKLAADAQTTQYTTPNLTRTVIDKFTATNVSGSTVTITVNLVTSADTAGSQNTIVKAKSLAANESYTFPEIVGHVLETGGFISTVASAASAVTIRASGREIN